MIALCILLAVTAIVLAVIFASDVATQEIELEIEMVPGDIDPVLESFKVGKGIDVAGLIGTDFLDRYGYIIDFKHNKIFHKFHSL